MTTSPKISIIIPVYNAEKYLHRCLNSILSQTFTDFEVLLINDGSPDNSGKICDEYALNDSRIKVFHKENGGVSRARQVGTDYANGEYIIHVDPDDWIEPSMLQDLYNKAFDDNVDMVICDFYKESNKNIILLCQKPSGYEKQILLNDILSKRLHGSCCNKLVKKIFYNHVSFPSNLNCHEDAFVIMHIISNGAKVSYLNKAYYHYCIDINPTSITHGAKIKLYYQTVDFLNRIKNICPVFDYKDGFAVQYTEIAKLSFCEGIYSTSEFIQNIKCWDSECNFRKRLSPFWKVMFLISVDLRMYKILYYLIKVRRNLKNYFS